MHIFTLPAVYGKPDECEMSLTVHTSYLHCLASLYQAIAFHLNLIEKMWFANTFKFVRTINFNRKYEAQQFFLNLGLNSSRGGLVYYLNQTGLGTNS